MEEMEQRYKEKRDADRKEKQKELLLGMIPDEEKKEEDEEATPEALLEKVKAIEKALREKPDRDPEEELPDKVAEYTQAMDEWEKERDEQDEADKENDEERPVYEDMIKAQEEKITEQREADEGFLEEFKGALEEKGVPIIDNIKTDVSADFVNVKLVDLLKDFITYRDDIIERAQVVNIPNQKELAYYEESFTFKPSKFGFNSPLSLCNPTKTRQYAVQYRERIYYLSDEDEKAKFVKEPSKYTKGVESIPLDVGYKPFACVVGYPKSGKSTLC